MGIPIEVIDAAGIEQRSAPLDSMHLIPLGEQEFRQVCAVLSRDPGDQCLLHLFLFCIYFRNDYCSKELGKTSSLRFLCFDANTRPVQDSSFLFHLFDPWNIALLKFLFTYFVKTSE